MLRSMLKFGWRVATKPARIVMALLRRPPPEAAAPGPTAPRNPPPPRKEAEPSPFDLQVDPKAVFERSQAGEPLQFVDVRQAEELAWTGTIPGALHVPTQDLPRRLGELDRDRDVILFCAAGVRSLDAAMYLREQGFTRVASLGGGLPGWQAAGGETAPVA